MESVAADKKPESSSKQEWSKVADHASDYFQGQLLANLGGWPNPCYGHHDGLAFVIQATQAESEDKDGEAVISVINMMDVQEAWRFSGPLENLSFVFLFKALDEDKELKLSAEFQFAHKADGKQDREHLRLVIKSFRNQMFKPKILSFTKLDKAEAIVAAITAQYAKNHMDARARHVRRGGGRGAPLDLLRLLAS